MQITIYTPGAVITDCKPASIAEALKSQTDVVWVDMEGPTQNDIRVMLDTFKFHPLAVEDTYSKQQRGKIEEYPDQIFLILNTLSLDGFDLMVKEVDIFTGRNYVVTVHNEPDPTIRQAMTRIEKPTPRVVMSSAYLLYVLLDTVVDNYFPILETLGERIEDLEDIILEKPVREVLNEVAQLKRTLRTVWQIVWPEQSVLSYLTHHQTTCVDLKPLEYYFRDINDHLIRVAELVNTMRDTMTSLMDLYMSSTSNRLNEVVNRLTVFTLIIGSLTVVGGFYGMNFQSTWPPFDNPTSVLLVIGMMFALVIGLVVVFRKMRWF